MLWYGDSLASDFEAFVQETIPVKPNYNVDEFGRLWPDVKRFPSTRRIKNDIKVDYQLGAIYNDFKSSSLYGNAS